MKAVQLYVTCACGWQFVGAADELVKAVRDHGTSIHGIALTEEQALAAARPYVQTSEGRKKHQRRKAR